MKNAIKSIEIIMLGLFTAIFLYPFLHETGHSLFILLFKGRVTEFNLFPLPNIACEMSNVNELQYILIGFGGNLLPFLLAIFVKPKSFIFWYVDLMVKCISLLSAVISAIGVVLYKLKMPIKNEDVTNVLNYTQGRWFEVLFGCFVIIVIIMVSIKKSNPLKKIEQFFAV